MYGGAGDKKYQENISAKVIELPPPAREREKGHRFSTSSYKEEVPGALCMPGEDVHRWGAKNEYENRGWSTGNGFPLKERGGRAALERQV